MGDAEDVAARARFLEATIGDGTPFFDAMDAWLCDPRWYRLQLGRWASLAVGRLDLRVVVSGEWGRGFERWLDGVLDGVLVLPGGLRHADLPPLGLDLSGEEYVFLDNSCYLGRTRDKIRARVEECGGRVLTSFVLYDGSRQPIPGMTGLFRYHAAA